LNTSEVKNGNKEAMMNDKDHEPDNLPHPKPEPEDFRETQESPNDSEDQWGVND
jgi:hypothetical protein